MTPEETSINPTATSTPIFSFAPQDGVAENKSVPPSTSAPAVAGAMADVPPIEELVKAGKLRLTGIRKGDRYTPAQ